MSPLKLEKLTPWDSSEHLDTPEVIEAYLSEALATGDAEQINTALCAVAKAVGMTEIAQRSGVNRQNLYRALAPDSKPRFDTVLSVMKALGMQLKVQAV